MTGVLYLVATPIGNLEDISARAVRVLGEVDVIAAEDTRVSRKLLNHFEIKKPLISYYEQNKRMRGEELLQRLLCGENIALITDAGMPAISDPGADIVKDAISAGIEIIAIPGASAVLTALIVSGMDTVRFTFEGFLPREKAARRKILSSLSDESRTMIFYEAPHRLKAVLTDMVEQFGSTRRIALCRELTKMHEQILRMSLEQASAYYCENQPRGEFVLVVEGKAKDDEGIVVPDDSQLTEELNQLMGQGHSRKQASRIIAEKYELAVKSVYDIGLR